MQSFLNLKFFFHFSYLESFVIQSILKESPVALLGHKDVIVCANSLHKKIPNNSGIPKRCSGKEQKTNDRTPQYV